MAELSPAARAVLVATINARPGQTFSTALRTAIDRAASMDPLTDTAEDCIRGAERERMRAKVYAIAAELEGARQGEQS